MRAFRRLFDRSCLFSRHFAVSLAIAVIKGDVIFQIIRYTKEREKFQPRDSIQEVPFLLTLAGLQFF